MQTLRFKIIGVAPLLLHNAQLADPLNDWAKAMKKISSKRNKTEDDHAELARLEWYGGLYVKRGRIVWPGVNTEACIIGGAKKMRLGTKCKSSVFCLDDVPLGYDGPTDIDELWERQANRLTVPAGVNGRKIMRTRAMFETWWLDEVVITYEPTIIDADNIYQAFTIAGEQCGFGDWRPRYGRFVVELL